MMNCGTGLGVGRAKSPSVILRGTRSYTISTDDMMTGVGKPLTTRIGEQQYFEGGFCATLFQTARK
jgi:hypothetical protein